MWRNGRRTGLKIGQMALSSRFFRLLMIHVITLILLTKIEFIPFLRRHRSGRGFDPKSSTKSSTGNQIVTKLRRLHSAPLGFDSACALVSSLISSSATRQTCGSTGTNSCPQDWLLPSSVATKLRDRSAQRKGTLLSASKVSSLRQIDRHDRSRHVHIYK